MHDGNDGIGNGACNGACDDGGDGSVGGNGDDGGDRGYCLIPGLFHKILFTRNLFRMTNNACHMHSSGEFKCRAMLLPRLYILYTCLTETECSSIRLHIILLN